jgi:hypothetical protein
LNPKYANASTGYTGGGEGGGGDGGGEGGGGVEGGGDGGGGDGGGEGGGEGGGGEGGGEGAKGNTVAMGKISPLPEPTSPLPEPTSPLPEPISTFDAPEFINLPSNQVKYIATDTAITKRKLPACTFFIGDFTSDAASESCTSFTLKLPETTTSAGPGTFSLQYLGGMLVPHPPL